MFPVSDLTQTNIINKTIKSEINHVGNKSAVASKFNFGQAGFAKTTTSGSVNNFNPSQSSQVNPFVTDPVKSQITNTKPNFEESKKNSLSSKFDFGNYLKADGKSQVANNVSNNNLKSSDSNNELEPSAPAELTLTQALQGQVSTQNQQQIVQQQPIKMTVQPPQQVNHQKTGLAEKFALNQPANQKVIQHEKRQPSNQRADPPQIDQPVPVAQPKAHLNSHPKDYQSAVENFRKKKHQELFCKIYGFPTIQQALDSKKYTLISEINANKFDLVKIPEMCLQVVKFEFVGANQHQVLLKDLNQDEIQATFHSSCKERIRTEVRRGSVLILQEVGQFRVNGRVDPSGQSSSNNGQCSTVLIVMGQCIKKVIQS